ncbi:hypothetical protein J7E71_19060 [Mesobacillus foraminis]|uniref:hypothetical protein n=1 Tax=Mesobacillus foraminis TaxID=279826 RepID=UPI001BEA9D3B|nr:hypothetical protein [Mesobacillus foraminis]MBT2757974.1 hypothetical protein [Mesobacillus foraminis]
MIGLLLSILIFNIIAFKTNKRLSVNQIIHIWTFTIAFQTTFDIIIEDKYQSYWYFKQNSEWRDLPAYLLVIPPVNMMFINWFPQKSSILKQLHYVIIWELFLLGYELLTLLPEPFGYFTYGWWHIWVSAFLNPLLLGVLLVFYRWIVKVENSV